MAKKKSFSTKRTTKVEDIVIEINDQEFKCAQSIPGMVLLDFVANMDPDNPLAAGSMVVSFFESAIVAEDWERFREYTLEPENDVTIELLGEIAGWLSEQYMGETPTEPAENSSAG